jgi:DnaJ homolog subfamily A member 5
LHARKYTKMKGITVRSLTNDRQFEAHLKGKKHIKAAQALRRAMREEDFALGVSDGMSTVGTATPITKEEKDAVDELPEDIGVEFDDGVVVPDILDEAPEANSESEPEKDPAPIASVEEAHESDTDDDAREEDPEKSKDTDDVHSQEDGLEKAIENLLLGGKDRTQTSQESKPKIGAAKAKRQKRAEKQAALEAEGKAPPKSRKPRKPYDPAAAIQKARGETVSTGKKNGKKK